MRLLPKTAKLREEPRLNTWKCIHAPNQPVQRTRGNVTCDPLKVFEYHKTYKKLHCKANGIRFGEFRINLYFYHFNKLAKIR
mmetsp:Transcript_18103/g.25324  ORF Transcript_18103/g.25324 Transcript_18103/m.25324 type:complete len:82 (+) Transcript_18103:122-367(+)